MRKKLKNWLIYVLVRFLVTWVQSVSRPTAFKIMKALAWIGYCVAGEARRMTIRHLSWAFGEEKQNGKIKQMAKEVFLNLGRNAVDAIRLRQVISDGLDGYVRVSGIEKMDRALAKGKGVLGITGHIGNWELLAGYFAAKSYPLDVIGAPVYDSRLDRMIVQNREVAGFKNIARGGATRGILRALHRGDLIGVLIDQDTRVDGVFVDFFGRPAFTPVGPVMLAMKTGAALVPLAIRILPDNTHLIMVKDEIELELSGDLERDRVVNTAKCSKAVEEFIRQEPTQWVWMHERWRTRPPEREMQN